MTHIDAEREVQAENGDNCGWIETTLVCLLLVGYCAIIFVCEFYCRTKDKIKLFMTQK